MIGAGTGLAGSGMSLGVLGAGVGVAVGGGHTTGVCARAREVLTGAAGALVGKAVGWVSFALGDVPPRTEVVVGMLGEMGVAAFVVGLCAQGATSRFGGVMAHLGIAQMGSFAWDSALSVVVACAIVVRLGGGAPLPVSLMYYSEVVPKSVLH
jgi:hypothetical protein